MTVEAPDPGAGPLVSLPGSDPKLCTAVVILLDSSSSMQQRVRDRRGQERPKHQIAREALERIIEVTAAWKKSHPDTDLHVGLYQFSSDVQELAAPGAFDEARLREALARIRPSSGTAIGRALETGFKALYETGCVRKHIVCITDGQNTSGPGPDWIARRYHRASEGAVEIHFVAFDTSASKFDFLRQVNGSAVEAADGEQLQMRLSDVYEKRILVEEPVEQPVEERSATAR